MDNSIFILSENLVTFDKKDTYYFVQIFKRRKDNPEMTLGVERLKSYCVYSKMELMELMPRIKEICNKENARAYIRLNSQNSVEMSLRCIEKISENIRKGNSRLTKKIWDKESGRGGNNDYWVIDIDYEHLTQNNFVVTEICSILQHEFEVKRKIKFEFSVVSTKSGKHLITKPFDPRILDIINKQFLDFKIPKIEIQKDANTLLYCK